MYNNRILGSILLYLSALGVIVVQTKKISDGYTWLELWPADADAYLGAVLYVYNAEEVNETQIKCTVQPGYATMLRKRDGLIRYSDNDLPEVLSKKIYDIDFQNEGNMTCSLSGQEKLLVSNTLTARFLCGETFVAAFRNIDVKNITKVVDRYNKEVLKTAGVNCYFQKYEGELMIMHFTLSNANNCSFRSYDNFLVNSFPSYLERRNIKVVYWRNTRHCNGTVGKGFNWPTTPVGRTTVPDNPCEDEDGAPGPIRRCLGDHVTGAYWDTEPDSGKCQEPSERADRIRRIENVTVDPNSIGELLEVVTEGPPLSAYEVILVSRKLKRMLGVYVPSHASNQPLPRVTDAVKVVDAVLESGDETLKKVEDSSSSTMDMVGGLGHLLIASATSEPVIIYGSHLSTFAVDEKGGIRGVMAIKGDSPSSEAKLEKIYWRQNLAEVNLSNSFWGLLVRGNTEVGIAASIYDSMGIFDDRDQTKTRISPVISLEVFGKNKTAVDPGTSVLVMFSKDENYQEDQHLCSRWNEHEGRGKWSQEGCKRVSNDIVPDNMQGCLYTHFTHIAMLISHADPSDDQALGLITKIGISASFICVAFAFLSAAFNPKRFQTVYGKIELNLFLSVFLLDTIVLLATFLQYPAGGVACIAVGVILHYSVLATFTWMMFVGLMHMLRLTPKTLLSARNIAGNHLLLKATIFGWGLAAIPVIATLSVGTRQYVNEWPIAFCYPHGIALYSAVIFPVALASVINTFTFIWVAVMLLCVKGIRSQGQNWVRQKMRRISFLFFLFCLLGLYWIFGLLIEATKGHKRAQKILKYVLCVTAPLHGVLLFVFLVLCERNLRSKLNKAFSTMRRVSRRFTSRIMHGGRMKETARFQPVGVDSEGQSVSKIELHVSEATTASQQT